MFTLGGRAPEATAAEVGYTLWLDLVFIVTGAGLWRLSKQAPQQAHCCTHHH